LGISKSLGENQRINILFTDASYYSLDRQIGGGEVHLLSLISNLNREKYNVFVAYPGSGPFEKLLTDKPITPLLVRSLRGKLEPFSIFVIMQLIKKHKIKIVHSYEPKSAFVAMIAASLLKVPAKINTVHLPFYTPYWKDSGLRRIRDRIRFLRDTITTYLADKIIAVSDEIREEKIERQHVSPDKVVTILNGADSNIFSPELGDENYIYEKFNISKGASTIGIVARLEPHKGHVYLLKAMPMVIDKVPEARLLIIGEGWYEQELRKVVRDHHLEKHVIFTGFQRDIPKVLSGLNLIVLPSLYESTNLSLIEAMLMEKPVVASAIPSHTHMVQEGVNGYLVKPKDIEGLANAITTLLKDGQLARNMGKKGREIALQRFSLDRMAEETEKVYDEMLRKVEN
jgi:glycosyltransferase involved in cell wall biosynthesis